MEGWLEKILDWVKRANDDGLLTLVGVLAGIAAAYFGWRALRPKQAADSSRPAHVALTPALRQQLLDRVQSERIQPRLEQGLLQAVRIDLGLTETPGAVVRRLIDYGIREGAYPPEDGPLQGTIREIFVQRAHGQLLILGDPGTGKTNLLLELGQSLSGDARRDDGQPIPIVFNLPRWTLTKDRTLAQWLRDDLAAEYGLSAALARTLVEEDGILPLLDGLDEVADTRQAACVEAIHDYQKSRLLGLQSKIAVCCRREAYESLPRLELSAAIRIEKLTRADVERETGRPGLEKVRAALDGDPELWEIMDTPLMLHVLYGAAQAPRPADSGRGPKQRLYTRYVEYALGRDAEDASRRQTDDERLKRWLGWLAARMRERDQSQFAFEELDYSWLPTWRARAALPVSLLFVGLAFAAFVGLVFGSFAGLLVSGLVGGLVFGTFVGLVFRRADLEEAMEELELRHRAAIFGLVFRLPIGLFAGLVFGLLFGLAKGLSGGLVVGMFGGLLGGLRDGLQPKPVSRRTEPNRGTARSLRYAILISAGGVVFAAPLLFGIHQIGLGHKVAEALNVAPLAVVWIGVLVGFEKGGYFALRHYTVRLFLWLDNLAPLRYVRFLNECTARLLLIRSGGSYEFFHITFRDFVADEYGRSR